MQVVRIGLDLAKYVFEVHGVDSHGKVVVRKDAASRCGSPLLCQSRHRAWSAWKPRTGRIIGQGCSPISVMRCG